MLIQDLIHKMLVLLKHTVLLTLSTPVYGNDLTIQHQDGSSFESGSFQVFFYVILDRVFFLFLRKLLCDNGYCLLKTVINSVI